MSDITPGTKITSPCQVAGCHALSQNACAICGTSICLDHVVNRDYALAGDEVGCPEHKREIDKRNAEIWHMRKEH